MESILSLERPCKTHDASSDLSNKSFLISPQNQKMLLLCTFDIQGIYEHITRKDRREKFRNLIKAEAKLKQGRYIVRKIIGKGSFGSVIEAFDESTGILVAIKIVRLKPGFTIHTSNEVLNLKKLGQIDQENSLFVKLLDYFEENGYLCIVLELLDKSLFEYIMEIKNLSLTEIIPLAQQLFKALLVMQNLNIVHCDLKPENIMLKISEKKIIKIVDMGSSCETGKNVFKFVQSRFYRAPEVTLRLEYGQAIDIWSTACILSELYVGRPLFGSRSENSQMSKTVSILGPLPRTMLEKSVEYKKYLNLTRLEIKPTNSLKNHFLYSRKNEENQMFLLDRFVDLISKCLVYEPGHRISANEALNHPFMNSLKLIEKHSEVPWPSFYTKIFLSQKQIKLPKKSSRGGRSNSIIHDNSPVSNQSTAVSRNSPRITSSDEDLGQGERPGSYVKTDPDIIEKSSNITP